MHPIERLRYVARAGDSDPALLAEEAALALGALGYEPRALVPASRRLLEFHPRCAPLWWVCAELLSADDPASRAQELAEELSEDPTADELAAALPGGTTVATTGGSIVAAALPERPDLAVRLVADAASLRYQLRRLGERVDVSGFLEFELDEALSEVNTVLIEAEAIGPEGALVTPQTATLVRRAPGAEVWAVAGRGRVLPGALFAAMAERSGAPRRSSSRGREGYFELEDDVENEMPVLIRIDEISVVVGPEGAEHPSAALSRLRCPVPSELVAGVGR